MIDRRALMVTFAAALAARPYQTVAQTLPASLIEDARARARRPFVAQVQPLSAPFADLTYSAYRAIRPIPGRAAMLPLGKDYAFDLFPPGLYFKEPVRIDQVVDGTLQAIPFAPDLFSFDPTYFGTIPETSPGAGFTGLRIRAPLNTPDHRDEFLVVQGASYFRAIGRDMVYGLSARAVALGSGGPTPEEFPRFVHLRLHDPDANGLGLEAVFDSPSLAGHVDMRVAPGADTVVSVTVTIFPRRDIADIGIAPLTSMYLKGPLHSAVTDDFRPRVHDSDVLLIENGGGETLWRPIANPARLETSAFADASPRSFALYQTPRAYEDYQDTEASYHRRPSAIVRPRDDWGPGAVVLVEIPTGEEFMDNIVAFWRPEAPLVAGREYRFVYDIDFTTQPPMAGTPGAVLQERSGRQHELPGTRRYVIDFAGNPEGLTPEITATGDGVDVSGAALFALPDGRSMRATFLLTPGAVSVSELRLVLRDDAGQRVGPVWLHRWTPARDGGV